MRTLKILKTTMPGRGSKKKADAVEVPKKVRKTRPQPETGKNDGDDVLLQQMTSMSATLQKHSEAISALEGLPAALMQLQTLIGGGSTQNFEYETDQQSDTDSHFGSNINWLIGKSNDQNISQFEEENASQELIDILNVNQPEPEYGPELQKDISESFGRMQTQKISKEKVDNWKDSNKPPINCKFLGVPRINPEIWSVLPAKARQVDFQHQQLQQLASLTSVGLARVAEKIFMNSKEFKEQLGQDLLRMVMEVATMNGFLTKELNTKRKSDIRPTLHKDIQTICSVSLPVTEFLFGDNICEQIKTSRATPNVLKMPTERINRGNRFTPYNNLRGRILPLNPYRASSSQRGGHQPSPFPRFRGNRGFRRGNFQSQYNNNQH